MSLRPTFRREETREVPIVKDEHEFDANRTDDDDGIAYLDNYKQILYMLKTLPDFPQPLGPVDDVAPAAYVVNTGPCCLVHEIMIMPDVVAPQFIVNLLEEARVLHNGGMCDAALRRYTAVLQVWDDPALWVYAREGLTVAEIRQDQASHLELRQGAEDLRLRYSTLQDQVAAEEQRRLQLTLDQPIDHAAAANASYGYSDDEGAEDGLAEDVQAAEDDRAFHELQGELLVVTEEWEHVDKSLLELLEPTPDVTDEENMDFHMFLWNCIGSVYLSLQKDTKALLFFYRAKSVHDKFIETREQNARNIEERKRRQEAAEEKAREAPATEMDELRDYLRSQNASKQGSSRGNSRSDGEDKRDRNIVLIKTADGKQKVISRSNLFPDMQLQPLNPFKGCSPATATTWSNIGAACFHLKDYYTSLCCYYAAQQIRFQCISPESDEYVDIASSLNNMGVCLAGLKRFHESTDYFVSAQELLSERLAIIHPRVNIVRCNLDKVAPKRSKIDLQELMRNATSSSSSISSPLTVDFNSNRRVAPRFREGQVRHWNVQISKTEKLIKEFGPVKKKKTGGKKKKKKR
jgi:hypothetical protein